MKSIENNYNRHTHKMDIVFVVVYLSYEHVIIIINIMVIFMNTKKYNIIIIFKKN
jgi:hypothetical protein